MPNRGSVCWENRCSRASRAAMRIPSSTSRGSVAGLLLAGTLFLGGCSGGGLGVDLGTVLAGVAVGGTGTRGLDSATVAAGLKDALRVGSERAATSTSATDGFLGNQLIRLVVPEKLSAMTNTLRTVGFGAQVDQLEVAMNRAAEQASGEAVEIFADQINRMTVNDALGLLNGGPTAATDYFETNTSAALAERFAPIVNAKMNEVGLARSYAALASAYNALPLVTAPALDLETYVTEHTLDGLFTVLGEEEKKIRENPAARTTDLLRRVFAG